MANEPNGADRPRDRRGFFQQGLLQILTPLSEFLQERLPAMMPREHLRPPGAMAEKEFIETCYRCGNCVEICPAHAIRKLSSDDSKANGTPYIDPDLGACTLCENLDCMRVCPSGALRLVDSKFAIRMGLAHVRLDLCLRTGGQDCTICVDRCPLSQDAILLDSSGHVVVRQPGLVGCVGCGVCQQLCPTSPKAIIVDAE